MRCEGHNVSSPAAKSLRDIAMQPVVLVGVCNRSLEKKNTRCLEVPLRKTMGGTETWQYGRAD